VLRVHANRLHLNVIPLQSYLVLSKKITVIRSENNIDKQVLFSLADPTTNQGLLHST
jgi:hypothetical protein